MQPLPQKNSNSDAIAGEKIELAINLVFINNESFFHSVELTLKFNGLVTLGTRTKGEI